MPIDSTHNVLGTGDINPPPGVRVETPEQKDLYRATMEFERFFVQHMMEGMKNATKSLSGDDAATGSAGMSTYNDMAQDQMVQAVLDGGGLGLAASLYQQIGEGTGIIPRGGAA